MKNATTRIDLWAFSKAHYRELLSLAFAAASASSSLSAKTLCFENWFWRAGKIRRHEEFSRTHIKASALIIIFSMAYFRGSSIFRIIACSLIWLGEFEGKLFDDLSHLHSMTFLISIFARAISDSTASVIFTLPLLHWLGLCERKTLLPSSRNFQFGNDFWKKTFPHTSTSHQKCGLMGEN